MSKSIKKRNKRKKGSSTDEELINTSKCRVIRGPEGASELCDSIHCVSDILSEANHILYDNSSVFDFDASSVNMASNTPTTSTTSNAPTNGDLFMLMKSISDRLTKIEAKLDTLNVLENKIDNFEQEISKIWCKLDDVNKRFDDRVSTCESKIDSLEFNDITKKSEFDQLAKHNCELKDELTYLKSQSMRNNLIFGGIEESANERQQDTEIKVRSFMVEKLQLDKALVDAMVIERAHRTGFQDTNPNQQRNRIIVCKFASFKDRETVRKQGHCLKNTRFFLKEQFPPEIAERRRKLIPQLRAARNEGKRAWLAYDTLYIEGKPVQQK